MVRSHIGNVVCRKALCVRVASLKTLNSKEFSVFLIFPLPKKPVLVYD